MLLVAALAEQAACNTIKPVHVEPTESPTPITQIVPTPFQPPATPTETLPTPTPTIEQRFRLGSFDIGDTPVTIETTAPLMKTMGFYDTGTRKYTVDKPYKNTSPYIDDKIAKTFVETATDNSDGNPGGIITTDRPNILIELVHSMEPGAAGEIVRIIGSYLIKNPDKKDKILGQELIITPKGQAPIVATIADVITLKEKDFSDMTSKNSFWDANEESGDILFLHTDMAEIPDSIRNDQTPGVYYLILSSCTPENGDYWVDPLNLRYTNAELSYHNTRNRTILVLKLVINP